MKVTESEESEFWEKLKLEIKEGRVNIEKARCPECGNKVFVPMIGWQRSNVATPENPFVLCGEMGHWGGLYSKCIQEPQGMINQEHKCNLPIRLYVQDTKEFDTIFTYDPNQGEGDLMEKICMLKNLGPYGHYVLTSDYKKLLSALEDLQKKLESKERTAIETEYNPSKQVYSFSDGKIKMYLNRIQPYITIHQEGEEIFIESKEVEDVITALRELKKLLENAEGCL